MQVICSYCGSSRTTTKNHGRKTGSTIGTVGMVAGPAGIAFGTVAGGLLGALLGAAAGCATGAAVGQVIDEHIRDCRCGAGQRLPSGWWRP